MNEEDKSPRLSIKTDLTFSPASSPQPERHKTSSDEASTKLSLGHRYYTLFGESISNLLFRKEEINTQNPQPSTPTEEAQYIAVIIGTDVRNNFLFSYTVYSIKVCITYPKEQARCWYVARSYSDFRYLDTKIKASFAEKLPEDFPELVTMKFFGSMEQTYVAFLLYQLRDYLAKILAVPEIFGHKLMLQFLKEDPPM